MACILIIDDNQEIRTYLRRILHRAGHQVFESADGEAGLADFEQCKADVVFCDLFMPVREGLATIRALQRQRRQLKIIAMSGGDPSSNVDFLPLAAKIGAIKTLRKPFDSEEVLEALSKALESSEQEKPFSATAGP
jgi:DNA-binding NtrC family response regulator